MPSITGKPHEHLESMLRRFKRACEKAGLLPELKKRAYFIKPTKERKQEKAAAIKRYQKKLMKEQPIPSRGVKGKKKKKRA